MYVTGILSAWMPTLARSLTEVAPPNPGGVSILGKMCFLRLKRPEIRDNIELPLTQKCVRPSRKWRSSMYLHFDGGIFYAN